MKEFDNHPHLLFAAVHYFRNWGHAVASCGINYEKIRRQRVWSREKIIKELKKYKTEGAELSYNAFEKQDSKLFHAAQYQFGSWKRALSFIDVDYKKIVSYRSSESRFLEKKTPKRRNWIKWKFKITIETTAGIARSFLRHLTYFFRRCFRTICLSPTHLKIIMDIGTRAYQYIYDKRNIRDYEDMLCH